MKLTKLLSWLLAILGFQMLSCTGTDEYGCPYTTYKTSGTVKDENGNKIQDAKVNVKIDVITEKQDYMGGLYGDTISQDPQTAFTDKKGHYETSHRDLDNYNYKKLKYEVITNKDGYKPDTIREDVNKSDFRFKDTGEWETTATHEINIVLKKK
ncbi:MAG: radical SAM-associated putative lipoprotein [Paludibacteraceae bacterium]|nr:radical SAM-associated putative lipoprotein [Paludibacteraceae bacterium]